MATVTCGMKASEQLMRSVCSRRGKYEPLSRGCEYGPAQWDDGAWVGEVGYYWFLAGLAIETESKRVFEAGTHFGGSARAFAAGGAEVFTCDVAPDGAKALAGADHITAVTAPAEVGVKLCHDKWGSVDLAFIDIDHEFTSTIDAIVAALELNPRWLVLDDVRLSPAMSEVWQWVIHQHPDAVDVDDFDITIRQGVGLGVIALHQ